MPERVPKTAQACIDRLKDGRLPWPLYVWGETGVGKSCAASLLYREWPKRAVWWRLEDFVSRISECRRNGFSVAQANVCQGRVPVERAEPMWWSILEQQDLAVFDDVGIRNASDAVFSIVFTLADLRAGRPTVFTSNVSPRDLAKVYDPRIASRMLAGTVLEMTGVDQRTDGKKQWKA